MSDINRQRSKVSWDVEDKIARNEKVDVIIEMNNRVATNVEDFRTTLESILNISLKDVSQTDRYISIRNLNRVQILRLKDEPKVFKIWLDKQTKAQLTHSVSTIKALAARRIFNVTGKGIGWAVLDTGIDSNNAYIKVDKLKRKNFTNESDGDQNGHGTHVAGIIASQHPELKGIAEDTELNDYKVLRYDGSGNESWLIDAMYTIRKINFDQQRIIIHGANISLGSPVDISYGTGSTPVCEEANRLVDSGVVVCVSAGNDGWKIFTTFESRTEIVPFRTFHEAGITDPGNAEKVITVGATHNKYPHKFGVTFFSSKGPTGDGRYKPDVVAPGENIRSLALSNGDRYDKIMSGTSQATPHVSGALCLFLEQYKEFIGEPLKVKELLMKSCTNLGRDRYFQGAGLIDVLRLMQSV